MIRPALLLSLLLPLAACNRTEPVPPQAAATPAPAETSAPSADAQAAAASTAASTAASGTSAAATPAAPAPDPAAEAAVAALATAAGTALVPGTDYVEIQGGHPYQPQDGKIEVVEVFNFICPACARFEPLLDAWQRKLPADVRLTFVPANFNAQWLPYAQAFVVADSMGLDARSHGAVFNAIHLAHTLPGEGDPPDDAAIGKFYAAYGADPQQFVDAMHSFATNAKLNRAKQFMLASGVEGTPTLIVNGRYRVTGKSEEDVLRITNQLIAQERAAVH